MYRRKPLSRKGWGILLIFFAIYFLFMAIPSTVKYNKLVEDYHSLTTALAYDGKLVNGTIDKGFGPFASTEDGGEVYLLTLDNGQFVPFVTEDKNQMKKLSSSDVDSEKSLNIRFRGKLTRLGSEDETIMLNALVNNGATMQQADKLLVPYSIDNEPGFEGKFGYMGAIICFGLGFLLFLPEFGNLVGHTGKKEMGEPDDYIPNHYRYNNGYGNSQTTQQNRYSQQRGQNIGYTGSQYSAQGQNRSYTGSQYSAQGQNRSYTNNRYLSQGQNRDSLYK